jgi:tetratricopeptide (TPR) repeat protein
LLQGDDAKKAEELEAQSSKLHGEGKFEEALKVAEALVALRERKQGTDHWEAAGARTAVEALRRVIRADEKDRVEYAGIRTLVREASAWEAKGRAGEALPIREKILAICRKVLGEEHSDTAASYNNVAFNLNAQGKYAEADEWYRKALAIQRKVLGEEHPSTATSYNNVAFNLNAQGKYAEAADGYRKALAIRRKVLGEEHPETARSYNNMADNLRAQGKYAEAEEGFRKALATQRKVLGEEHPTTAISYNNLASNLTEQGKHAEAEEGFRKALAAFRKVLGEEHPNTAQSYNNLASNLKAQGKYAEAEEGFRKALAIQRKVLGEEHPSTAISCGNLASNLAAQGKYAEAEEGFRKALAIHRKVLGEEHPSTAISCNSLASNLAAQGKYAEAEEGFRKALAAFRKVLGEEHANTANSYNNLAGILIAQGRYAEAEEGFRKALAIQRKVLGEGHPDTAGSYHNLASNLDAQGKYAEAEEGFHKALAIHRKVLGEEHPATANSCNSLASNLAAQGKYAEAEEGFRKALTIHRKVLGEEHPATANSYNSLAGSLQAQGKYERAETFFERGADCFAKARLHIAATGLDRARIASEYCNLDSLASVLARNGKPDRAWQRLEESLGRGSWDDLSSRLRRPEAERIQQAQLVARLQRLDQLFEKSITFGEPSREQKRRRDELFTQRLKSQEELAAFTQELEKKYGPIAGQVFDRAAIQATLPADTALIVWVDTRGEPKAHDPNGEHWAMLLRTRGTPIWERLRGTGPKGEWTEADTNLPFDLHVALQIPRGDWQALAKRLREQRLAPLTKHLDGIRKLVVLPSSKMAGVPVEVIAEGLTVSYHLSGTMFTHFTKQPRPTTTGLLALGDPIFEVPASFVPASGQEPPLPPGGVLLTVVIPGSNAAKFGLRPNDVLLRYGTKDLAAPADLPAAIAAAPADKPVPVVFWREGRQRDGEVQPGKLGVVVASEPAPRALAEQRRLQRKLATRGGDWAPLPGTRVEIEALRRFFEAPTVLTDSEASEQRLHVMAQSRELGKYRYLHLATHGAVNNQFPLRSAVILSRDKLPDRGKQFDAGLPIFDGELTAEKVLSQWNLNAELVTPSACQTALGKHERGEGFVGFAQALMLSGTRSVCLSLWKVDDAATALLMERFYQNLLGKREGLKGPLPKVLALEEAKTWLRTLPREEALQKAAALTKGVVRGKDRPVQPLLPVVPEGAKDATPYAHPYYWAAFVLVGDPE